MPVFEVLNDTLYSLSRPTHADTAQRIECKLYIRLEYSRKCPRKLQRAYNFVDHELDRREQLPREHRALTPEAVVHRHSIIHTGYVVCHDQFL